MTSNMTMTAISICNFLKLIVKSTVEHYTEDFKLDIKIFKRYAKEAQETGKPVSMLWFCRSCGTYTLRQCVYIDVPARERRVKSVFIYTV